MEYGIIGTSVTLLIIAGFTVMGGRLNNIFVDLKDDMADRITNASQAKAAVISTQDALAANQHQEQYFPGAKVCYANGMCLDMAAVNHQGTVESTGANGARDTIHEQANLLTQIAEQLASDPNADPTLLDLVTRLSLAGHGIGNGLDQSINSFTDPAGFFGAYDAFWRSVVPYTDLKNQLSSYLTEHPGALPPEMQKAIDGATNATFSKAGLLIGAEGPNYDNWDAMISNPVTAGGAPIHQDSNTICQNGGNQQVCVQ
ncbi:MAG: hypothetical protein K0Q50_2263 [Vampirovibrio sp.]|nr:hypothetical protein [Vampirovibrio sp.]